MKKRIIALLSAAVMTVGMLSGCSGSNGGASSTPTPTTGGVANNDSSATPNTPADPNEPTWKQTAGQNVKFDWYINFSWFGRSWGNDVTSKYITEKTGVDIEYVSPAGNEAERINTMIAANMLPALITLDWSAPQVRQMIDAGLVYSLDELAEQYDPYFFTVADEKKISWYKMEDGHTYGYPNASYSPLDYEKYPNDIVSNQTFLVKKDMYEAIGSPDMTTPEGFIAALEKAKEMFPTVNNQPLIPLGLHEFAETENYALEKFLHNLLAVPFEKENEIYDRYTDPEYVTWLKTLRLANEKGLISNDLFIDKRSQMEEKIAQGRYFAMIYQSNDMISQNSTLYANDPNSAYIAVDGPKNSNGEDPTLDGGGISGWTLTMISKNCKDPARAIQFLSYLISEEGQHDIKLGPEELWSVQDGRDLIKPEYAEMKNADNDKWENEFGGDNTHWMLMDNPMQLQWSVPFQEPLKQTKDWTIPYVKYNGAYDNIDPNPDTTEAINLNKIKTKWLTSLVKMLTAKDDAEFDTLFQEFLDYRDNNGFADIQKIRTEKMQLNKQKLGM